MINEIMKYVKVTLKNISTNTSEIVYEGEIATDAKIITYKDQNGTLSHINFEKTDTLEIDRIARDYTMKVTINKEKPYCVFKNKTGVIDLPVRVLGLSIKENRIYACYDTGEKIELMISIKE